MARAGLIWAAVATAVAVPIIAAALSPLLAWRDAVYIVACLAGVVGLALMMLQPLLIGGYLPGLRPTGRDACTVGSGLCWCRPWSYTSPGFGSRARRT